MPFSDSTFSAREKLSVVYSKIKLYYTLKIVVEDSSAIRGSLRGYLLHLAKESEHKMRKGSSDEELHRTYQQLHKSYCHILESMDKLLRFFPHLLMLEADEINYLTDAGVGGNPRFLLRQVIVEIISGESAIRCFAIELSADKSRKPEVYF